MSFRYGYVLDSECSVEFLLLRSPDNKLEEINYSIPMIFSSKMITIKQEAFRSKLKIEVLIVVLVENVRIFQHHQLKVI
jgi:hypothetical protein